MVRSARSKEASSRSSRRIAVPHIRRRSKQNLYGWPLYEIAIGPDLEHGEADGSARAWIAIGDRATGVLAIGGLAQGIVAVGGLSAGVFAIGGCTLGLAACLGGVALGPLAMGGVAIGWLVRGGAEVRIGE
jgi:hypothetical protein